ncbi:MAG: hypothetical protein AB1413_06480 [Thermodesulfobacteriota bacterium]
MECERLQRLVKNWYAQVQDEAMAPARMVLFLENHIADCQTCLADPLIRQEVEKITAIILPPSKVRKAASALEGEEEGLRAEPEEELEESEEGDASGDESESEELDEELGEEDDFGDEEEEEDDI